MCPDAALMTDMAQGAAAMLARSASPLRLGASVAGMVLAGGAFTALSVPAVARFVLPPPRDTRLADHLPFDRLLPDDRTLVCRDGTLVQCVIVEGRDITFLSAAEREALFRLRKNWLDAMAEFGVTLRGMLLRERVATPSVSQCWNSYRAAGMPRSPLLSTIAR
jgi:hypothetical protein